MTTTALKGKAGIRTKAEEVSATMTDVRTEVEGVSIMMTGGRTEAEDALETTEEESMPPVAVSNKVAERNLSVRIPTDREGNNQ